MEAGPVNPLAALTFISAPAIGMRARSTACTSWLWWWMR